VQRHGVHHEIMGAVVQRQRVVVGHDPGAGQHGGPEFGMPGDNRGPRKAPVNVGEPFLKLVGGVFVEEQRPRAGPDLQDVLAGPDAGRQDEPLSALRAQEVLPETPPSDIPGCPPRRGHGPSPP